MTDKKEEFPETIGVRLSEEDRSKLAAAKEILESENKGLRLSAGAVLRAALYSFVERKQKKTVIKEPK